MLVNKFSFFSGERTRTWAADKRAAASQSAAVYPANGDKGYCTACWTHGIGGFSPRAWEGYVVGFTWSHSSSNASYSFSLALGAKPASRLVQTSTVQGLICMEGRVPSVLEGSSLTPTHPYHSLLNILLAPCFIVGQLKTQKENTIKLSGWSSENMCVKATWKFDCAFKSKCNNYVL